MAEAPFSSASASTGGPDPLNVTDTLDIDADVMRLWISLDRTEGTEAARWRRNFRGHSHTRPQTRHAKRS